MFLFYSFVELFCEGEKHFCWKKHTLCVLIFGILYKLEYAFQYSVMSLTCSYEYFWVYKILRYIYTIHNEP